MASKLDHIAFTVVDVIVAQRALREIGFAAGSLGVCRWHEGDTERSARCLSIVFAGQYLDFIESSGGPVNRPAEESGLRSRGIFPSGIILNAPSFEAALHDLRALALVTRAPYEIERRLAVEPDVAMRYRFFSLSRRASMLPVGVIEDLAPDALRRPDRLLHPNGATSIAAVHLRAADGIAAAGLLQRLTNGSSTQDADGPRRVSVDGVAFHFHSQLDGGWLEEVAMLVAHDAPIALLAIELAVRDLAVTEQLLGRSGVALRAWDDRVLVDPRGGYGCGIAFTGPRS
jgi:hypothetical protein